MENYIITHLGEGVFQVIMNGIIKDAGPNLCGMIRYTYFEDYTLPDVGWSVTNKKLLEDYFPKAAKNLMEGKIKPDIINP